MSTQTNCTKCQKEIHEGMTCEEHAQYLQFVEVIGNKERAEIFKKALKMLKESTDPMMKDCVIQFNENILKNEQVLTKFVKAFEHVKFESVEDIIFGWHGGSDETVASISRIGFDPMRRKSQAYGRGEYFGSEAISSRNFKQNCSKFIFTSIIKGNHVSFHNENKFIVVDNPVDGSYSYCLPLFVCTFKQ